ncbi:hypothetical protein, partial [Escherichia coli]|uniref:hypothetical protein n=1 Tax=Escherichia coli TaxID=562 RepID=UPI0032E39F3F
LDVSQDLISDVVASMGDLATIRAHSFRFARLVQTRVLLASKGTLTGAVPGSCSTTAAGGAEMALRIEELIRVVQTERAALPALPGVQPTGAVSAPGPVPVQHLLNAGTLKYLTGTRVAETDMNHNAGSRILGREELLDPHNAQPRFITLLNLAANHPAGRL